MYRLEANWPAPASVQAFTTTRLGGVSLTPYDSNNLGLHVNDNPACVLTNRKNLALPREAEWLTQTHSTRAVIIEDTQNRDADAAITREAGRCLVIMTADCLPIVLCNEKGTEVAAIHAGWRGLVDGVIEQTLSTLKHPCHTFMAWIGPSACGACYEVGEEVRDLFIKRYPFSNTAFKPHHDKWLVNLPYIATSILNAGKIQAVYQSKSCTIEEKKYFYSYRREGQTGRMGTFIWFTEHSS